MNNSLHGKSFSHVFTATHLRQTYHSCLTLEGEKGYILAHAGLGYEKAKITKIVGNLSDLENSPILSVTKDVLSSEKKTSYTFTFCTAKGTVTVCCYVTWYTGTGGTYDIYPTDIV